MSLNRSLHNGYDQGFTLFDELRRRLDHVWEEYEGTGGRPVNASAAWPPVNVFETTESLVFLADVPGLTEKDFTITLTPTALTVSGQRRTDAPEGYSVHRREREGAKFSRSWTLPYKVDGERTTATVKDGVLTVTLGKAAEAQPRQIAVRAQA